MSGRVVHREFPTADVMPPLPSSSPPNSADSTADDTGTNTTLELMMRHRVFLTKSFATEYVALSRISTGARTWKGTLQGKQPTATTTGELSRHSEATTAAN